MQLALKWRVMFHLPEGHQIHLSWIILLNFQDKYNEVDDIIHFIDKKMGFSKEKVPPTTYSKLVGLQHELGHPGSRSGAESPMCK